MPLEETIDMSSLKLTLSEKEFVDIWYPATINLEGSKLQVPRKSADNPYIWLRDACNKVIRVHAKIGQKRNTKAS